MSAGDSLEPEVAATLLAAGTALASDHVAVEVSGTLAAAGVRTILLRGPSVTRHLYGVDEPRGYVDADLLVARASRAQAEHVLADLGFARWAVLGQRASDRPAWSSTWVRARGGGNVDLHWTIVGARVEPDTVWSVFEREVEPLDVLGTGLEGLSASATALVVTLHAAHHGARVQPPVDDLARALHQFSHSTWERASELAGRIDAIAAFQAGLRLLPAGGRLADRLGLPDEPTAETILRAGSAPPMALGFDWLAHTPGLRAKVTFVLGKIVPDREFMRAWSPLARRGDRLGIALAYLWRPFWLLWHGLPGFRAWHAARRKAAS
jgi:Uncharacterised nucleotidyltransferase